VFIFGSAQSTACDEFSLYNFKAARESLTYAFGVSKALLCDWGPSKPQCASAESGFVAPEGPGFYLLATVPLPGAHSRPFSPQSAARPHRQALAPRQKSSRPSSGLSLPSPAQTSRGMVAA